MRNIIAVKVCNFILRVLATKSYRDRLDETVALGLFVQREGRLEKIALMMKNGLL